MASVVHVYLSVTRSVLSQLVNERENGTLKFEHVLIRSTSKCDLNRRTLTQTEIDEFCNKYGFYGYMEMSVKKDIMVTETMK
jgi:hypothetical protein